MNNETTPDDFDVTFNDIKKAVISTIVVASLACTGFHSLSQHSSDRTAEKFTQQMVAQACRVNNDSALTAAEHKKRAITSFNVERALKQNELTGNPNEHWLYGFNDEANHAAQKRVAHVLSQLHSKN